MKIKYLILLFFLFSCQKDNNLFNRILFIENQENLNDEDIIKDLKKNVGRNLNKVNKIVKITEDLYIYYEMLAELYFQKSMFNLAIENYKKALEIKPLNKRLYFFIAICYKSLILNDENIDKSIEYYDKAITLDSSYHEAIYGKALLLNKKGEYKKAIILFNKVIKLDESNINARFFLAECYIYLFNYNEAEKIYREIIIKAKNDKEKKQAREKLDYIINNDISYNDS